MVGCPLRQSGTETRRPWGILWPGEVQGYILRLFSLPLARWLVGLLQRADEGIGPYGDAESPYGDAESPYGDAESHSPAVGADALIRPPVPATTTARAARSGCAAVGGFAALRMRRTPCG